MIRSERPNFLLFITDQHRADHLGCAGHPLLRTPHIDALAARGCRFTEFHVATPICQPNRASLMTGRLPSAHGLQLNGRELSHGEKTFVQSLREAGYRTALAGKSHLQNITSVPPFWPQGVERLVQESKALFPGRYGQEVARRWDEDDAFELDLPYYGFEQVALTIGHADEQSGHWRRWLRRQLPDADRLIGPDNALPTPDWALTHLRQAWRTQVPEALYPTSYIAEKSCEMLQGFAAGDAPFFLQCSFPDPHHPFTPPGRYWDMYRPSDVELPHSFDAELIDAPPPVRWLHAQRANRPAHFKPGHGSFAVTHQEAREALALNYGNIACIDDAIGRVMTELQSLGLAENTVVMFTSDHGDLLGDRGLMFKGGLHDGGLTRVPFIWSDLASSASPSSLAPRETTALAQTIDIAATVLARAGLAPVHGMQGRSLLPVVTGQTDVLRASVLIEEEGQRLDFGLDQRIRMRTLRTLDHRISIYDGQPWGELCDLRADPLELRNLWNDPASQLLRMRLMGELAYAMLGQTNTSPYPLASA
ncbi:sulfatase [Limnohabitans sp. G3-2]|uniref:sulfatase family protein n=1 Tax=Limnohabitans sp. G3-2 TaxID=1100711 RepID=UPI000C1F8261|nr:sulfatase-like hydrolase/transferase [Limnohabitans sp. G3-2]PIT74912.1 sulfatase [Limnohabitans sp. G3-2]